MPIVDEAKRNELAEKGLLLKRDISPTTAATDLYKAMVANGIEAYNLGQGCESETPPDTYLGGSEHEKAGSGFNHKYGTVGGGPEVREIAAAHLQRFFGINAAASNTFVVQAQGRAALQVGFMVSSVHGSEKQIAMPLHRWAMLDNVLKYGSSGKITPVNCPIPERGQTEVQAIIDIVEAGGDNYGNYPLNPTGTHFSKEFLENDAAMMNEVSGARLRKGQQPGFRHIDIPYWHALKATPEGTSYYDHGFDIVANPDAPTPYVATFSGSKALGAAKPGFTIVHVHPSIAKEFSETLMTGIGVIGSEAFFNRAKAILAPENDANLLKWYAGLGQKYETNFGALQKTTQGIEGVDLVNPDPMIVSLSAISENMLGRTVHGDVTGSYLIQDTNDILEYLALNYGVVTVNNGEGFLRFANAEQPKKYAEAMTRLKAGFEEIAQATPAANMGHTFGEMGNDNIQDGPS
ncbi:MAG: hypothetical protein GC137_04290 [Alphaproteobacteria bacterium]|nr:hypothetical protein [Alphaproteobacteria bacterium]